MLPKNGFEGIAHFMNHPEMLPYVGGAVLFVGECVHLPNDDFADKAESFKHWYEEPTPKFIEGISEQDWRMAKVYFDVRLTVARNYDKYADLRAPRLLNEVVELYSEVADKTFKRYLNEDRMYNGYEFDMGHMDLCHARGGLNYDVEQNSRERFLHCSYCTYFQRPNLTAGKFKEIIPDEDKYSFEIFFKILEVLKPRLVIVLSAKASESIKRRAVAKLPCKTLLLNSAAPSDWTKDDLKKFKSEVRAIFKEHVQFHLQNWLRATGPEDLYFTSAIDELLLGTQFRNRKSLEGLDKLIATNAQELISKNPAGKSKKAWFNCYPLNIGTDKIFPLFLAICRGDEKLENVFDEIFEQADKISAAYPKGKLVKRNIVLLTDKWDNQIFDNYRRRLLKYEGLIHFVFGLIKETQITTIGRNENVY